MPPHTQRAARYIEVDLLPTLRRYIQKAETPAKKKGGGFQVSCVASESSLSLTSSVLCACLVPYVPLTDGWMAVMISIWLS